MDFDSIAIRAQSLAADVATSSPRSVLSFKLPDDHRQFLDRYLNGGTFAQGALRLFGCNRDDELDIDRWNASHSWKSCWPLSVGRFYCFAETMWGDQFAYDMNANPGSERQAVYTLDGNYLRPTIVALNFPQFLQLEVLKDFGDIPNSLNKQVAKVFGEIPVKSHVVFAPSPLLGGDEVMSNALLIDATDAMSMGGDIAQFATRHPSSQPNSISPYRDAAGLARLLFDGP